LIFASAQEVRIASGDREPGAGAEEEDIVRPDFDDWSEEAVRIKIPVA
jgi:hypothetical protein